jgi:DNA ligase-1
MRALDVLDKLEQASGKNDKIRILQENKSDELRELLDAALNFNRKFFVKKLDIPDGDIDGDQVDHQQFLYLLNQLETRTITGNEAKESVWNFLCDCDEQQRKWYSRIICKDLKAGFDISTANKAGYEIEEFDVMLAKDGKQCKKLKEIVQAGVYISPKLDGYRCIAICDNGVVTLHSRNGAEYENFPDVVATLEKMCTNSRFVLDGEIMSSDFNAMQRSAFASKRGTTVGDVKYHVFGFIPFDEWHTDNFKMPTKQRLENLQLLLETQKEHLSNIEMVSQTLTHKLEHVLKLEEEYIAQGYEGAMILPNIPYFRGRKSNRLMKFKTMQSQDCTVVGVYEGEGKYKGSLGGLHLIQEDGKTKCDVGSGFSDDDRAYIFANPSEVIGRTAEIKHQDFTPDGVMRFPIFLRWRNDK